MKELHLNRLKEGLPGITPAVGTYLAEAAAYCLDAQGYQSGVILKLFGNFNEDFALIWTDVVDDQVKRAWDDQVEAIEYAPTARAILLILELTNFTASFLPLPVGQSLAYSLLFVFLLLSFVSFVPNVFVFLLLQFGA